MVENVPQKDNLANTQAKDENKEKESLSKEDNDDGEWSDESLRLYLSEVNMKIHILKDFFYLALVVEPEALLNSSFFLGYPVFWVSLGSLESP